MRTKSAVPAAAFKTLFNELITWSFIYALLRRCGVRRRCPPVITAVELIQCLVFHVVAEAGTLAQHVKQLTGKTIADGALAQRRALLPAALGARGNRKWCWPSACWRRNRRNVC